MNFARSNFFSSFLINSPKNITDKIHIIKFEVTIQFLNNYLNTNGVAQYRRHNSFLKLDELKESTMGGIIGVCLNSYTAKIAVSKK